MAKDAYVLKSLKGGERAFLLRIKEGERTYFWSIETQVQIDKRFRDVPKKRVDFLISPVGGFKAKPIVVEMDGLKYHADTVADDLTTRLLLIRSGHVRVWTLGWHDLEKDRSAQVPNPVAEERLGAVHAGLMAKLLSNPAMAELTPDMAMLQGGTSLQGLIPLYLATKYRSCRDGLRSYPDNGRKGARIRCIATNCRRHR